MPARTFALFALVACSLLATVRADAAEPRDWAAANIDDLVSLYRQLHQAPELSLKEERTAARLADELRSAGATVTTGIGGHGVVGLLENGAGPTLMLRTDLDALPVTEETGLVYASQVKATDGSGRETGVMHACGHDIHMTNLVGVARYLAANRDAWQGTVMFVCQPAEELGDGAKNMLDDGLFEKFTKPDFALALHCDATLAAGRVGYIPGFSCANVDSVDITIKGRGGHGAKPETTIDPIVIAAHLIVDLQTIVSREVSPQDPAVVTVGSIHGGTKHNIIGDTCHLELTVRSFTDESREHLLEAIRRKALAAAASARAPEPIIHMSEYTPAVKNDDALVERIVPVFRRVVGDENVELSERTMGGEDFSRYGRAGVPSFMFRLGSIDAQRLARFEQLGQEPPSLHSALYYPDAEETLKTAVTVTAEAVRELLPKQ
jgi:amidohydrolase